MKEKEKRKRLTIQELHFCIFPFVLVTSYFFGDMIADDTEENREGTCQTHTGSALEN